MGEISQHGLVTPRVAPSLEINLTTTTTLTPRRHSQQYSPSLWWSWLLSHGGLRHNKYFYQDGPGPDTRGLAVSLFVFFPFDQHVVPQ